jgi:hypothetical protein
MKQYLLTLLVASGLLALIPTESKAQVVISLRPSSSDGYYYQDQPRYYHGYDHRYYRYHREQRYYRWHRHNDD